MCRTLPLYIKRRIEKTEIDIERKIYFEIFSRGCKTTSLAATTRRFSGGPSDDSWPWKGR
jgi:hypothetical protein